MAFTTTSNYAGKAAGFYISAALKQANSLDFLTTMENIKFKSNIQKMAGSALVADATCDFTGAGTLALTEKVLEPKNLQVNLDLCKKTLLDSWEAAQMRAGAGSPPPASFDDYVISYVGEIIAEATEESVWGGTAVAGKFNGFNGAVTGLLLPAVDGTVVQDAATAAYSAANIIANLQAAVAAIPSAVLGKEDLHIYLNQKTYRYYISAISTLGYVNAYNMNGDYIPVFEGIKLAVCNGMVDNEIVIAEKSNLFFGTDLISDATRITLMDMAALDGSDNMRLVARYSAGVQTGTGADIVRQS
tara:strand:- start:5 stop:910 length:906 start_codon:yes stop_codon:yes gene_type:complete